MKLQSTVKNQIPYEERFGNILPRSAYPLPLPEMNYSALPKWWNQFLDFAEDFVQIEDPALLPKIPRKYLVARPKNTFARAIMAGINYGGLYFYSQWILMPKEEEQQYFPNGLQHQKQRSRENVLHAVHLARTVDIPLFVAERYAQAYDRCLFLCGRIHNPHFDPSKELPVYGKQDVETVFKDDRGWINEINYDHIKQILLKETSRP